MADYRPGTVLEGSRCISDNRYLFRTSPAVENSGNRRRRENEQEGLQGEGWKGRKEKNMRERKERKRKTRETLVMLRPQAIVEVRERKRRFRIAIPPPSLAPIPR